MQQHGLQLEEAVGRSLPAEQPPLRRVEGNRTLVVGVREPAARPVEEEVVLVPTCHMRMIGGQGW
jgi:hypothetical protein